MILFFYYIFPIFPIFSIFFHFFPLGYHIYLETGRSTSAQTLAFTIASTTGVTWKIRVSQIECFAPYKAPSDCYQYFTGVSGNVQTLNFAGGVVLRNQQYLSCIRQESGYCGIEWKPTQSSTTVTFDLGQANAQIVSILEIFGMYL